jgi:hypothetical protein
MPPATIAAWRQSEMEQADCREGMRLAALEFYWARREEIRLSIENDCTRKNGFEN